MAPETYDQRIATNLRHMSFARDSFARDLGAHRIRANTVVPGWVMTERQKALWVTPAAIERHRERQCLPDLIEPVIPARMALFLTSDDAAANR